MKRTVAAIASAILASFLFNPTPAFAGEVDDGTVWKQMDGYSKYIIVEALISGHDFGSAEIAERSASHARRDTFSQSAPFYAKRLDRFYADPEMVSVPFGAVLECMADQKDGARCTKMVLRYAAGGR